MIDASVIINLNATRLAAEILSALPSEFVVARQVAVELEVGRSVGRTDAELLARLVASGATRIVDLGLVGARVFEELVCGDGPATLDDGEAATIGYAIETGGLPVFDEKKAHSICRNRYQQVTPVTSVDLLAHETVHASLGHETMVAAVYDALQIGRMNVLPHCVDWVVELIGRERAANCRSLSKALRAKLAKAE
ncbi:MAG: hypothetical protein HQ481_18090 [Alphaproteobacteria bacterium]|nr:hypothetical protein [Alphaproteobacteria bacterium]